MFKEVSRARHTETLSAEVRDTVNLPKVMTSAQEKDRSAGKEPAQEGGVPASSAEAVEVPGHKTLETHAVASSVGGLVPTVNTHQLSVLGPDQNIHSPAHSVETQPLAVQPLQNVQSEIIHIKDTHSETVFTPRPGRTRAAIILGPGEAGDCTSHLPSNGLFLACQERASQLEVWLEEAQLSLTGPVLPNRNRTMQDSVEKQLQCCQEMFLDLEQKVSSHSSLGHDEEEKIALITKLQVLKNNLVTVQLLLQERYSEEQVCVGRDHPLQAQLQHSTSVQQILTSKGKIFRQSSLQQQRELEQGLSEQKDLTKAIVEQGTRALLHSQSTEEHNSVSPPVSEDELRQEEEESAQRKWAHLHRRLTQRAGEQQGDEDEVSEQAPGQQQGDEDEVSEQAPGQQQGDEDEVSEQAPGQQQGDEDEVSEQAPGQISTPSVCVWNYDDGAVCLQELQSHSIHLKKLVHAASSAPDMQTVDEGLFELLSGIERSLSSLLHTLLSDTGTIHADAHHQLLQLQSLSAELTSLGAELTSQGSELMRSLGSGSGTRGASACLGLAQARVSMVQNILSGRQHQLQKQMDHMLEKQRKIKNLHASLLANTSAPEVRQCDLPTQLQAVARLRQELREKEQELADLKEDAGSEGQAPGLTLEITTLESMLDRLWCGVRERCAVLHYGQDQQCHGERLLHGLRNLVELARDRLTSATQLQLHSPEELHTYLTSHTKFFLSLGTRLQSLQQLSSRTPDSALCGREAAVADLEEQVEGLQRQAQEAGTALQAILRLWSEWEESQSWLEKLLQDLEIQLPKMHLGEQMDEALQESLSTYETLQMILEQNRVQICLTLDQPRRLQREPMSEHGAGVSYDVEGIVVRRAGVSSLRLKQRLAALRRKVEHGRDSARQMKKLWSRYRRDHAALNKWMSKTRECLHTWISHMTSPNQEAHQALSHYKEFIELSKELEVTSVLKASVISAGTEILALSERVHQDGPSQPTGTTARSALETTVAVRQPAGEDAPDKDVCSVKNNITVDTVSAVDPVLVEDVSTNGDSRSQAHASAELLTMPFSNEGTTTIQDECPEDGLPTKDISGSVRPQAVDTCGGSSTSREVMLGDGCGPGQSAPVWTAALSPALLTLQSHLAQTEQRWAETYALVPTTQLCLHQRMVERMCPQGLLAQAGSWISTAEARLQEAAWELPPCATAPRLQKLLSTYKVLKREMSCEQMSLGFLTQSVLKHSELDCPSHRHRHTAFAEQLGTLNLRWEALSAELNTQVCNVEQLLGICTDRDGKLRLLRDWVMRHSAWMRLAERPVSLSLAEHSLRDCEELEAKLNAKSAELSDLRKRKLSADEEHRDTDFIRQTRRVSLSLSDLAQQNHALKKTLQQVCKAWSQFDSGRRKAGLNTLRLSQSLEYCHTTQTPLAAFQKGTDRLQALQDEAEQIDRQWEELSDTLATLTDGINTGTSQLLSEELEKDRARWSEVKQNLTHTSRQFHTLLQVWRRYSALAGSCSQRLEQYREQLSTLAKTTAEPQSSTEKLTASVRHVCELLTGMDSLQNDLDQVLQTSKELIGQMEPTVAVFIQLECRLLTRGCLQLEEAFKEKLWTMQEELKQFEEFEQLLESLETHLEEWQSNQRTHTDTDISESGLLELSSYSADLELLNELSYRLALGEPTTQKLQSLNRKWVHASALAQERCSELQAVSLQQKSFEERCKTWTVFLQRMEDSLVVEISSTYPGLREQLRTHQRFQAELPLGHQILHSVITGALHLLNRGEVEDRSDFLLKLAQLRERWQEVVWRAAQGRSLVVGLTQHWRLYTRTLHKLQRLLTLAHALVPPAGLTHRSVPQLRRLWDDMERAEMLFQRSLSSYLLILEVGKQLFSASGEEAQMQLQTDLATLQDEWESTRCMLGKRRTLTADVIQNWDRCMLKLADHAQRLEEVRVRLKQPIQDTKEERGLVKEIQDSLENWVASLSELNTMKTDLSQYIITDDILLLQEQVDHLHCQWEELCLKVSLRKQEIADHLNAWIIFNEKNKELCEWLTQMENEVAHSAELSIEDMVEKLKKDCMEEINLFSENKTHLKQLGEQLITASNKTKEAEINDKLKDINDRWLHLFDHIEARVKKLKGTLVMVQQLDKNMSNLRTWLSRIEGELAKPIVYRVCHGDEIQRKLAEQQELQRDIEQHTEGVASVLTLCDVLLHDTDACGSDAENDSIQQTTHSLDRRWRNICAMSMERRMRIEETWRLWSKFMEDYSRFEEWLSAAERTAANPASADVLYTCAKEELKKFEAFQRQVHERLTQLELVNKQYRRLARENRTDTASKLKMMVNEGNQRWDTLQRRVTAVLRRLKHFTSQRDDFEGSREAILMWLTEMDLQLTNVEHFSESDIRDKMRQLDAFRQEITLNTDKIDALIVFGENLIQKSCPVDAVLIEEELEEMHSYCQEVFGRVDRFHRRLVLRRPVLDEEYDFSDRDADVEDSLELETEWARGGEPKGEIPEACSSSSTQRAECHGLLPPPLQPSGRDTPGSVDSIPLEWDHTVDVGGSSSPEDEEEVTYYSALSDIEVAESSEACVNATARALSARPVGRAMTEPPGWHSPAPKDRERIIHSLTSSPTHVSTSYHPHGYAKLMSECNESIDNVKRVKLILNDGEVLEDQGLTTLSAADQHTSVIERWELLGARQACVDRDVLRWGAQSQHGMGAELDEVTVWLDSVLPELDRLRRTDASGSIRDMETSVRELKEMQRTFSSYKALMIGVNLSGRDLQHGDNAELDELREGLRAANQKWMCACASLDSWEGQLQRALLECQEFHETLHSLLLWLARAESQRYMVNIHDHNVDTSLLQEHRNTLRVVYEELQCQELEVRPLQEISSHILQLDQGDDSLEAKEKVHVIGNKLRLLLRQVTQDLSTLQARLDSEGSDGWGPAGLSALSDEEAKAVERRPGSAKRKMSPTRPLLYRVLRAALPIHVLLLLVLALACLVPPSEDDYSCALSNTFARSFYPMLRYTNGPPPT